MARTYVFRLTAEGVRELERDFKSMGDVGERAFGELSRRVPGLSGVLETANQRLAETRARITEAATASGTFQGALDRTGASLMSVVGRYATIATAITTATRLMHTAAETNKEAAEALEQQTEAWNQLAAAAAPTLTFIVNRLTNVLTLANQIPAAIGAVGEALKRPMTQEEFLARDTAHPIIRRTSGIPFASAGNIEDTVTVTPRAADIAEEMKKAEREAAAAFDARIRAIQTEFDWWEKFYADKRALADKARADEKAAEENHSRAVHDQIIALSEQGWKIEQENAKQRQNQYDEDERRARERLERIHGYWTDTLDSMTNDGAQFFENFFATGEGNLGDFVEVFKRAWARLFADLATQQFVAPLMRSVLAQMGPLVGQVAGGGAPAGLLGGGFGGLAGLGGIGAALGLGGAGYYNTSQGLIPAGVAVTPAQGLGGAFAYQGLGFGSALGGAFGGAGIGGITGMIGGNTTGGMIGGAVGGAIGSIFGPLGTMVGGALGGAVGGMFGGKPSNYRATATFSPGGGFSLSGDKPNDQTLSLAQQAAAAIQEQVSALTSFGVEFQKQLANIWIGQRDASSFQLVGGQRVSVGTVGNAGDLAQQTLTALMKGATSSDPLVAAQLGRGYGSVQELMQALTFAKGIESSLKQITDPLGAAIDLWKQEAQARLDMAAATGVSIEKVQQLNAALYGQIVNQANQGVVNNIGGYLSSLQYGPDSIAPPGKQYQAALADYEKARAAAMKGGAPEAQAYLEATQQFLPFAREYLGTTQTYASLEGTAKTTLESLASKLSAPAQMPELVTPIVQATNTVGAATVEAVENVSKGVGELRESVDRLFGEMSSLMRQMKTA